MNIHEFDFELPAELIAQTPSPRRGEGRLLKLDRATGQLAHTDLCALPALLRSGDLLVVNNTRVFPARLLGRRVPSGGAVECLLIRRMPSDIDTGTTSRGGVSGTDSSGANEISNAGSTQVWEALVHPGQKLKPGGQVIFEGAAATIHGEVLERRFHGRRLVRLRTADGTPLDAAVDAIGHVPLPPYIKRGDSPADRDRYQTIFARERGSVAAPTAGLHLSEDLFSQLARCGIETAQITLHVGYGTFQPVRVEQIEDHRLEPEAYEISSGAADAIGRAQADHRRVIAVGTTTTRTLEAVALAHDGRVVAGSGTTDLFIHPGCPAFQFRVIRGLLTNFHLPQSSLLMLVSAFAGRDRVLAAYREAVRERYRFYSYGDAMLVV
jgi:S-adenosylmethionine:tRNA ribosyltransferase-isomerase